ncbi:MAG: family 43 glycosylhydrolase [Clostridia bacterium]|nr:family 43 glycosylhydrolase [Clostridia bacterium]
MKKQAFNPYLPSWEYIPDGEPYVFGDRVYVYGSHDFFNGCVFCMGDYMGWSAPVNDLSDWRCEGVIFPRNGDPCNADGKMCLYAPDVTRGPDGRYYLYYVYDKVGFVSVAVCDSPAGRYEFLGYVHYKDGTRLGDRPGDEPQFDPGVLTEGDRTYLYTGFAGHGDKTRHGAMCTVLGPDMVTIEEAPVFVAPGDQYAEGTGFAGHAFFEASSIRKRGDTYYFVYSSEVMHELCYATSKDPRGPFVYGGVIVSNIDLGIDTYKPADRPAAIGGNNHGSIVEIHGQWYIFYHRQTNASWFSRQGCAEPIFFDGEGKIRQAEITSCGLNGGPLKGEGEYPAYIACHLYDEKKLDLYSGDPALPKVTQEGGDGDKRPAYIAGIHEGVTIGFKYFDCRNVRRISVTCRAYAHGRFEVRNAYEGPVLAQIPINSSNVWEKYTAELTFPDGKQALYLTYRGPGNPHLGWIGFEK